LQANERGIAPEGVVASCADARLAAVELKEKPPASE
jgi:hypothetical protein